MPVPAARCSQKARTRTRPSAADVVWMAGGLKSGAPERRLAAEVVLHAVREASSGDRASLAFLSGTTRRDRDDLAFWCEAIDLDPDLISQNVARITQKRTRRQMQSNRTAGPKPVSA